MTACSSSSPASSRRCAAPSKCSARWRLRNAGTPEARRIEFRVGINLGDIIVEEHDIYGDGVNIAARLEGLADPGGICVSRMVHDQVRDKLEFGSRIWARGRSRTSKGRCMSIASRSPATIPIDGAVCRLPEKPSLAVLPFQNMTGDAEQDYFVDGVVEEITTAISRLPWLFVIAAQFELHLQGKDRRCAAGGA